jgi:signal transduction histidine kinase
MNEFFPPFSSTRQEASLGRGNSRSAKLADVDSAALYDLAHELRQPLGVIESLAYYLELISVDDAVCTHLRRIQAMVAQANGILERVCDEPEAAALIVVSS